MIDYGSVSTTERVWVSYDGLINLKMLKIQSGPFGNTGDMSSGWARFLKLRCFNLIY